jgi:hypothetical protein
MNMFIANSIMSPLKKDARKDLMKEASTRRSGQEEYLDTLGVSMMT